MSVQFGRWSFDGTAPNLSYAENAAAMLAPYGEGGHASYDSDGMTILHQAFPIAEDCGREKQPHVCLSGAVLTWEGRLDNRAEFIGLLRGAVSPDSGDVAVVAAGYERWGTGFFSKLAGDWALSVWNPREPSLILAKDPIGTHHLYYALEKDHVTWSSILDPLVLCSERRFSLEEEYLAGWLAFFPATHLTPYAGIRSVPPSSFVRIGMATIAVTKYWDFNGGRRIHYRSDSDYEEHFRTLFAESVKRRLRSEQPILAELSGGMDSSAIVCMADEILKQSGVGCPRVDTISYYDDSEPNWNERPFFTKVEQKRGRAGCHVNVASEEPFTFDLGSKRFAASPAAGVRDNKVDRQFAACMRSGGNRVLLCGVGGDEVMGGVPTPIPELADLLTEARFKTLAHKLKVWALNKRKPWFHLLFETVAAFFPAGILNYDRAVPWLVPEFAKRYRSCLTGYESRLNLGGPLPSFQSNQSTLRLLQRQLACTPRSFNPAFEKRYPYLDRDLLEFMYAIPREQLVRPGQRRSLMRRALAGIVPNEILNRKRKAFVARAPMASILSAWPVLGDPSDWVTCSLGIIESRVLAQTVESIRRGQEGPIIPLMRTLSLETWLRNLRDQEQAVFPSQGEALRVGTWTSRAQKEPATS